MQGRTVSLLLHCFDQGGSGRVAAYLARGLHRSGLTVDLTVFARGGPAEGVATEIIGDELPIHYFGDYSGSRPVDLIRSLPAVAHHLRSVQPAAVIACANNVALVGAAAVRMAGLGTSKFFLKTTNPIASSRHKGAIRSIRRWSYRFVFTRSNAVWTLSPEESAEMRQAFPAFAGQFRDVANPYVTPPMLALPRAERTPGTSKTIIAVARLTPQKRLDRLINAFAKVKTPGVRLVILGEGEERASLAAVIASLGLAGRVSMPGFVRDVATELHSADLFVLTSAYEGLPAVVLEAMAANCPVLSTDCFPAAGALVGNAQGCAIIPDGDDADALALQIDRQLEWPRPTKLRPIAERYSIANGILSHIAAMQLE
jgi:glycosyltransferase involved in cell wall biosynthesis